MSDLGRTLDPGTSGDAQLLVSELVTNSVTHGQGESVIVLVDDDGPDALHCEVIDQGNGFVPRGRGNRDIGGWGLQLVEQIASRWGVRTGSTHVWFELGGDGSLA